MSATPFCAFAVLCGELAVQDRASRRQRLLAGFLHDLGAEECPLALDLLGCSRRAVVGPKAILEALAPLIPWDAQVQAWVLAEQRDPAAFAGALLPVRSERVDLTLEAVARELACLAATPTRARVARLREFIADLSPLSAEWYLRLVRQDLGIGMEAGDIGAALAVARDIAPQGVARALLAGADLPSIARAITAGTMDTFTFQRFQPLPFQRAERLPLGAALPEGAWRIEALHSGVRCQLHAQGGAIQLLDADLAPLEGLEAPFATALEGLQGDWVFDGVLMEWDGSAPVPLARADLPAPGLFKAGPTLVCIVVDCLRAAGADLTHRPLRERLAAIPAPSLPFPWIAAPIVEADLPGAITKAQAGQSAPLMLRDLEAPYALGSRSTAWLKVAAPFARFTALVTGADLAGTDRNAPVVAYSLAVRDGEALIPLGKVPATLPEPSATEVARLLRRMQVRRYGASLQVQPRVVLEIVCAGVVPSRRHKAGLMLIEPSVTAWPFEQNREGICTLDELRALLPAVPQTV